MKKIVFGLLLDGSPAEIKATDEEASAFERADSYQSKLLIARRAAFRQRMVSMLLTGGHLETNLNCREPGPHEETVFLAAGQFGEQLDHSPRIELGAAAVKRLSARGCPKPPPPPDKELLAWLDPVIGVTTKDLAETMGVSRTTVQKRLTAMNELGVARRSGPSDRHTPVRWYLAEQDAAA